MGMFDICPRCGNYGHLNSLSKDDNKTEICSSCSVDETLKDAFGEQLSRKDWHENRGVDIGNKN